MFENFQTENKLRPSFASLLPGTFLPMGRHEADGNFCCLCGSKKHGEAALLFENFQTENKLRPSFASLLLGTFPPPWEGMKRLTVLCRQEKKKKIEKNL